MSIRIFYDGVSYRLKESKKVIKFIDKVIREYISNPVNLSFIFTNDENLIVINKEFLKNNYKTDVITFKYNNKKEIDGEIYMSIETIKRNSINYKVSLKNEVLRVMIHGSLHLCGFNDVTKDEKEKMHDLEDYWLSELRKK